ncbi:hypothetical protein AVEN_257840-1 [Araneus ventricosus]|uniref:Uncharacterized protein n=1 Tax=Araneus ventricosus TaxID=182803 RepID=A0A4Y2EEG1_ARAVE|nr:hypothetical protein AVEN_257840-1 [Araneus ventricosus]
MQPLTKEVPSSAMTPQLLLPLKGKREPACGSWVTSHPGTCGASTPPKMRSSLGLLTKIKRMPMAITSLSPTTPTGCMPHRRIEYNSKQTITRPIGK